MESITGDVMQAAAEHVIRANREADVHTVTLELNGQHGGVDLVVLGFEKNGTHAVEQMFRIGGTGG